MQRINQADPGTHATTQRLSTALIFSLVVHAALVWVVPVKGGDADLPDRLARVELPRLVTFSASLLPAAAAFKVSSSQRPPDEAAAAAGRFETLDPRYYGVEELDVLPTTREPIRLGKDTGTLDTSSINTGSINTVRLLARIDASGRVIALSAWGSDTAEDQIAAAMHALGDTPFNAARKNGQPVRSEVVIELAGGSGQATARD